LLRKGGNYLCAFTADSSGELHILWHDGDTLGVDGAQVGVLEQADHVSFSSFLEGQDSAALESQIALVFLSDVSDESLEWELSDQQLSGLLVSSDFTVPGLNLWAFLTPPTVGAVFLAVLLAMCLRGALAPVFFLAVCLVLAIVFFN
jgi:histone H3